tara:strand:- start:3159 stop:3560 length:402 start_codon:yes stop_codon:yes gene_type:complete
MSSDGFIPLGDGLNSHKSAEFISHAGGESATENRTETPKPVTPAEANDLEGQIREILSSKVPEESVEEAITSIKAAIVNAPARVALPEIKLQPSSGNLPEEQPTIDFEREGDTVKRVQINCSCGQSIHLDCVY